MRTESLTGLALMAACITVAGLTDARADAPGGIAGRNPDYLRMAMVNMKCLYTSSPDAEANRRNLEINLARHLYFIEHAADQGAEFIGFPEVSINGYDFSDHMIWLPLDAPELEPLKRKAAERSVYVAAGIAEIDANGNKWNTHFIIGPDGKLVGKYHKIWLTAEAKYVTTGTEHPVFDVKGAKLGIILCADGTDFANLEKLANNGAQIIYGSHGNSVGGTTAGWYQFRSQWGGAWNGNFEASAAKYGNNALMPSGGWIQKLKVYGALHNHACFYNPDFDPPVDCAANPVGGFASGAWFIGPDGETLAQMSESYNRNDSKEYVLIHNIPITSTDTGNNEAE